MTLTREEARQAARRAQVEHSLYEDLGHTLVCLCGAEVATPDEMIGHAIDEVVDEVLTLQTLPSDTVYALIDDRAMRPAQERLLGVFATWTLATVEAKRLTRTLLGRSEPLHWSHDDPPTHLSIPTRRPFGRRWRVQVNPGSYAALHWSIREQPLLGAAATLTPRTETVTEPDRIAGTDH